MKDIELWAILFAVLLSVSFAAIGAGRQQTAWQKSTVERGLALYCPLDGEWAWIGECKE